MRLKRKSFLREIIKKKIFEKSRAIFYTRYFKCDFLYRPAREQAFNLLFVSGPHQPSFPIGGEAGFVFEVGRRLGRSRLSSSSSSGSCCRGRQNATRPVGRLAFELLLSSSLMSVASTATPGKRRTTLHVSDDDKKKTDGSKSCMMRVTSRWHGRCLSPFSSPRFARDDALPHLTSHISLLILLIFM